MSGPGAELTPAQQRTLDALRRSGDPVVFDRDFVEQLHDEMAAHLVDFADRLGESGDLWVSKHGLAEVLDCEAKYAADDEFTWSPATAAGSVTHRAIQLTLGWRGDPAPLDVIDEAIARLAEEERGAGSWLAGLDPADEADLRSRASGRLTQFLESFPPLEARWRPATEVALRWPVAGRIVLGGKTDLSFGAPAGMESRKVIIDLKTGGTSPRHRQDLAFYALVETLRQQVPPRKVASFYIDAAAAQTEDVTEPFLLSAKRRTLDGIDAMVALAADERPPVTTPGTHCRWCPLSDSCPDGIRWLADSDRQE